MERGDAISTQMDADRQANTVRRMLGEILCTRRPPQTRREDTTHQMKGKKQKMVENELMTQNLRNKLGHSNDEFKCPVQSAVALCETFSLLRSANLRVVGVSGQVSDGSGTNPSETGVGKRKGECERHAKTGERLRKCMGIRFWWPNLQDEGCGTRGERPCQIHQCRSKNKEIWDTTAVRQRSEWELLIPQNRDGEKDMKRGVNVIKRTELTSSSTGIVMLNPRDPETGE